MIATPQLHHIIRTDPTYTNIMDDNFFGDFTDQTFEEQIGDREDGDGESV